VSWGVKNIISNQNLKIYICRPVRQVFIVHSSALHKLHECRVKNIKSCLNYLSFLQESQIAILYVAGFASSVLFGTCTGPLADIFGRRCASGCYLLQEVLQQALSFLKIFLANFFVGFLPYQKCEYTENFKLHRLDNLKITLEEVMYYSQ
jgi:hypothetical protein